MIELPIGRDDLLSEAPRGIERLQKLPELRNRDEAVSVRVELLPMLLEAPEIVRREEQRRVIGFVEPFEDHADEEVKEDERDEQVEREEVERRDAEANATPSELLAARTLPEPLV